MIGADWTCQVLDRRWPSWWEDEGDLETAGEFNDDLKSNRCHSIFFNFRCFFDASFHYVIVNCCRLSSSPSSWVLALWNNSWRRQRKMFARFHFNPGRDGALRSSRRCHTCTGWVFMRVSFPNNKTSPQLWPPNHPRQLDLWHNLHPTQRAGEDWECGTRCDPQECQNLQRKHQELPLPCSRVGR